MEAGRQTGIAIIGAGPVALFSVFPALGFSASNVI